MEMSFNTFIENIYRSSYQRLNSFLRKMKTLKQSAVSSGSLVLRLISKGFVCVVI